MDDEIVMVPSFPMEAAKDVKHNAEIDSAREIAEVQAQVVMAMRFPRVKSQAMADILDDCKRISFAKEALFSYARGGATISDGSIKLALVMAQNWGNLDYGVRELERRDGESIVESSCWDLQKNVRQRRRFAVPHKMKAQGQIKTLTDPRDIYEHIANLGARRLRACIFDVIPADVKRAAIAQVKLTLEAGNGEPLADRVTRMIVSFRSAGVSVEMIEKKLGHKHDITTAKELVDLQAIYNSIREGASRSEFFDIGDEPAAGKAADLSAKLHGEQA